MAEPAFLSLAEVIDIHTDQLRRYGGQDGVRDFGLLESALAQPEASFAGEWLHQGWYDMAAAYAYHLCQNHPFIDGNKRTALACALVFLELNGLTVRDPDGRLKEAMVKIASGALSKTAFSKLLRNKRTSGVQMRQAVLQFNEQGLIPTVVQDAKTKQVLTLCYLNRAALERSLKEGKVYVFRRSQKRLMLKGETSGHVQHLREVRVDCEGKSLVFLVRQRVAACHAGYFTCYFRRLDRGQLKTVGRRVFDPEKVYR